MTPIHPDAPVPRRLGVVGTLVWDTIHDQHGASPPVQGWGGIAYALGAFEVSLEDGWEVVPLLKVGSDLEADAKAFLSTLPRLSLDAVRVVPEPNNRVEIQYRDPENRTERLTGGVPGWTPTELEAHLGELDALHVNFISGFEMELTTARWLRDRFAGPIYCDLHSLFLGVNLRGERFDQELADAELWLQSFNAVQMNETEFNLLGGQGDPWRFAAAAVGGPLELVAVTTGTRGAEFVTPGDFQPDPMTWSVARSGRPSDPVQRGRVAGGIDVIGSDPTGCGDVWGATTFARLLGGDPLDEAMRAANRAATRNAQLSGAASLHERLRRSPSIGKYAT